VTFGRIAPSPAGLPAGGCRWQAALRAAAALLAAVLWLPSLLVAVVPSTAVAQSLVAVPALERRVTDLTKTLDAAQVAALEAKLAAFETRKGSQVVVLMLPTTKPEAIEQYSIRVAEAWKIGRRKVDDGALLLVAKDDRALRIEVGYGLEGALPDAIARRIIDEVIVPRFRSGDFAGGIEAGLDRMIRVIDGEPLPAPTARQGGRAGDDIDFGALLVLVLFGTAFAGGILRAIVGKGWAAGIVGTGIGLIAWSMSGVLLVAVVVALIAMVLTLAGASTRGGGWSSGGGSSGGSSGGSWGGGGGGFGGGGASGRW
jgi:uncharacterized protein